MTSHPPSYEPGRGTLTSPDRARTLMVSTTHEEFLCMSRMLMRRHQRSYRTAMASIRVPVLMVQGDKDRLVPVAAARDIAGRHPHWRYLELPGVGHVPQLQVPERIATEVLAWLHATEVARAAG